MRAGDVFPFPPETILDAAAHRFFRDLFQGRLHLFHTLPHPERRAKGRRLFAPLVPVGKEDPFSAAQTVKREGRAVTALGAVSFLRIEKPHRLPFPPDALFRAEPAGIILLGDLQVVHFLFLSRAGFMGGLFCAPVFFGVSAKGTGASSLRE